ncbi:glycosyltransferase family 4 protein [Curtobacterium sp. VKM Ac-2884]|uniref:glycosyltransferase family 4 protein n=1 Tax=Curtobacterium sp. VKM Ac-2884 TaxID=2783818 RepID=UPI00188A3C5D|nr:glycosyltransferase family 1 protein [Curtobacterium sp. VKM Ac-2884]MBF4605195.1 glycosyltransferase family 4 protein [Curtobacterium sp. VKM Ac-2884]
MRVLFDGYWWMNGPPSGHMVLREVVGAWRQSFPADELHLVVPAVDLSHARAESPDLVFTGTSLRFHPLINSVALRHTDRRLGPFDATLAQNFAAGTRNSGVFVHDVLFQSNPEWFTRTERIYLSLIPRFARRADIVFTSSRTEVERIKAWNPELQRVESTGLGVPTAITREHASTDADPELHPGRFLLTVGRLNVRKNVGTVIDAVVRSGRVSSDFPLVVVGSPDGRTETLSAAARTAVTDGSVRFTGAVDDARLAWLYRQCRMMLFMSLDEGYGLPPIEALASGAPVIASDRPVLHEVLGDAVTYADPRDTVAIADAVAAEFDHPWRRESSQAPGNRPWADVVAAIRAGYQRENARR